MTKSNTPKLNDLQLIIVSSASQRDDGLAAPTGERACRAGEESGRGSPPSAS